MFGTYRTAFRVPGSRAFSSASFLMRLPISIYPLGLILLISTRTHHYGFAGVLSGAYVLGSAAGNPLGGRLVDRYGQHRVLLPMTAAHVLAIVGLVLLVKGHTPDWTLLLPTIVIGFCFLPVGSMVRARWSYVLDGRPELATAYSFESTADELIYIVGPLLATVIATEVDPLLVVILAGSLVAAGAVLLARLRGTEPPAHPVGEPRRRSALRERGMVLAFAFSIAMGIFFSSAEVTMVAFCGQRGQQSVSGAVLASMAVGSAVSGLWYGGRQWRRSLLARFRIQSLFFAVVPWLFLAAVNVGVLAGCAFVVGLAVAPTLITLFGLVSGLVHNAALTEGLTWVITGVNLGYGIGAAAVGRIADAEGARTAFGVSIAAATALGLLALWLNATLRDTLAEPVTVV